MLQLVAFVLTLAIELPAAALFRHIRRLECGLGRLLIVSALGTTLTHPIVSWGLRDLPWSYWAKIGVIEPFAVIVEAGVFVFAARVPLRDAAALSLFINAASFGLGYLFRHQIFALVQGLG